MQYINLAKSFLDKIRLMKKLFILYILSITLVASKDINLEARFKCGAYNDLKHTKNSNGLLLEAGQPYSIKQDYKNNYLVFIKGANPPQRWVDKSCFANSVSKDTQSTTSSSKQYIFSLSWHDGFCTTHKKKKECQKSFLNNDFVLHGLWPQPKNSQYCGVDKKYIGMDKNKQWYMLPEPKLTIQTQNELAKYMPAVMSNLDRHEWIKHGVCSGLSEELYFKNSLSLTKDFIQSPLASYIAKHKGDTITFVEVKKMADISFGVGSGEKIEMICDNNKNLTEMRLSIGSIDKGLNLGLKSGLTIRPSCQKAIVKDMQ